jgi:hypothetical protein
LLLTRPNGTAWRSADITRPFNRLRAALGLAPETTAYSLRHSYIVRQILSGTPIRVIAAACDTSTKMIEKHYSAFIGDHSDVLLRKGLLNPVVEPVGSNVVKLKG